MMNKKIIPLFLLIPLAAVLAAAPQNPPSYHNYLLIKYLINMTQFEKADRLIDRHLAAHPKDPFILTEKALILKEVRGRHQEALDHLKKALDIYPGYYFANYLKAAILLTEEESREQKLDTAVQCLEFSLKDNPDYHDSYFLLGIIMNMKEKHEASNRYFEKALRLQPSSGQTYYYMAANFAALGDNEGLIRAYKEILTLDPSDPRALLGLSQAYLEKRDYKNANIYLEPLYHKNPKNHRITVQYLYSLAAAGDMDTFMALSTTTAGRSPQLDYTRALILAGKKKYRESLNILEKSSPPDPRSQVLKAQVHLMLHNYPRALEILQQIPTAKRDAEYYSLLLNTFSRLNLNRKVIGVYRRALESPGVLNKLDINDFYLVLSAYADRGMLDEARAAARTARERLKDPPPLLIDLIKALEHFSPHRAVAIDGIEFDINVFMLLPFYRNNGDARTPVTILKKMIKKKRQNLENVYLELCDIYLEQNKPRKAEKILEMLIKKYPSSMEIKNFYAYFLALQNKELDYALQLSAPTLAEEPENPSYLDTYGYILFRQGKSTQAREYIKKAYEKHPFEPEIMEHLAGCYREEQNHTPIVDMYRRAIAGDVDFKDELTQKLHQLEQQINPN